MKIWLFIYKMLPSRPFEVNLFRNGNQTKTFSPWIHVSKNVISGRFQFNTFNSFIQINITSRVLPSDQSQSGKSINLIFLHASNLLSGIIFSRNSTTRFVCVSRLVGWLVGLFFSYFFDLTAPAQMVGWPQIWPLPTRTRLR